MKFVKKNFFISFIKYQNGFKGFKNFLQNLIFSVGCGNIPIGFVLVCRTNIHLISISFELCTLENCLTVLFKLVAHKLTMQRLNYTNLHI